jgi:hypothetical protein
LPSPPSLEVDADMNEMSETFHGLKAASQLLLLVEDDVATG